MDETRIDAPRIEVEKARKEILSGKAIFVCGYEDDEKYLTMRLDRSMSFSEFKNKLPDLAKEQEIIFYCG